MEVKLLDNKVAITKNGKDIIRIIPFNDNEDTFEIKISPQSKECNIKALKLLDHTPLVAEIKSNQLEITYHIKNKNNDTKIHVKINNEKYHDIPLNNLTNLSYNFDFPIPLIKLVLPFNSQSKSYKKKKAHIPFDLDIYNTAEIYLISNTSWVLKSDTILREVIQQLMTTSFEFYTNNKYPQDSIKSEFFNSKFMTGDKIGSVNFEVNKKLSILVIFYRREEDESKETYTFIDNIFSKEILLMSQISLGTVNEKNEYDYIEIRGCKQEDLQNAIYPLMIPKLPNKSFINYLYNLKDISADERKKLFQCGVSAHDTLKKILTSYSKR